MKILYFTLASFLLLNGCAQTPSNDKADSEAKLQEVLSDMELEPSGAIERIPNFQIDNWKYLDHYHVIIETRREQYLIAFQTYCSGINNTLKIGYTSRTGSLTKFEKILVEQPLSQPEECYIEDIVKLNSLNAE